MPELALTFVSYTTPWDTTQNPIALDAFNA